MIAEREALRKGIEHLTVLFPTVVSSFDFQVENSGRTVQYKLNAQSLRLFGLHSDVNDAHRAGANRVQNKTNNSFFKKNFWLCIYSSKKSRIIELCSYSFFWPELILHKYSVEGYLNKFKMRQNLVRERTRHQYGMRKQLRKSSPGVFRFLYFSSETAANK